MADTQKKRPEEIRPAHPLNHDHSEEQPSASARDQAEGEERIVDEALRHEEDKNKTGAA